MSRIPDASRRLRGKGPGAPRGFSLLELMVALAILSFVMAALYVSVGSSAAHARRLRERMEHHQAARRAMQRMAADLEGLFVPPVEAAPLFSGDRGDADTGRADRIEFVTPVYTWGQSVQQTDDLAVVAYWLATDGEGNRLLRQKRPLNGEVLAEGRSTVILEGVKELRFEYLDRKGTRSDAWAGRGPASLPAAVRVTFILEGGGGAGDAAFSTLIALPAGARLPAPEKGAPPAGGGAR
ncbi:MAG: prepilin-type N-terminal cleavage/methylation domain-containing protein [Candidatus Tectomicrobia bacterium]|uniref:Type II secretion system protein J n=1 Tax=Tectimicrobiota bacterium TaxID=2528274 RepID=A0A932MP33_UNCTE|nr:prepilin-type N-terminal cleavage/methylation domain-containing protein [Candidatus Tectomicrobia bacterium]